MFNYINLSTIGFIVIALLLLRAAYNLLLAGAYYIKYIYLKSDPNVNRGHSLVNINRRDSVQFVIGGTSTQILKGPEPFKPIDHSIEENFIKTAPSSDYVPEVGEEGFVMPTTPEEWSKYDEPTYLRRGKFFS